MRAQCAGAKKPRAARWRLNPSAGLPWRMPCSSAAPPRRPAGLKAAECANGRAAADKHVDTAPKTDLSATAACTSRGCERVYVSSIDSGVSLPRIAAGANLFLRPALEIAVEMRWLYRRCDQQSTQGLASTSWLRGCWHELTVRLHDSEPRAACGTNARRRRASRQALVDGRHR